MLLLYNFSMNNLKKLREEREIKQIEVADYLGITKASYSQMESNIDKAKAPTLKKIALFFNVSIDYLIGLIDEPVPLKKEKNSTPPREDRSISLKKSDREALKRTSELLQEILEK